MGVGVPLSTSSKENAMDMSMHSRADLERALLCPRFEGNAAHDACHFESQSELLIRKLAAARELLMRDLRAQMQATPIMNSPQVVRDWLCLYFARLEHEVFVVLYLNSQHALIEAVQHFSGTLTQTSVYPREIIKGSLTRNAAAIVCCRNHPSGSAEPSRADEALTQALKGALALVDVWLLDHFIVAGDRVTSLAERGLL
jgi:DNA repair protein RadC